jgi:hypothetical protein
LNARYRHPNSREGCLLLYPVRYITILYPIGYQVVWKENKRMTNNPMVEKAIMAVTRERSEPFDGTIGKGSLDERITRAAIEALREPTEEMHHAARDWSYGKYGKPIGFDASEGCWKSMIDAALKDTKP